MITFIIGVAVGFVLALFNLIFLSCYWKVDSDDKKERGNGEGGL